VLGLVMASTLGSAVPALAATGVLLFVGGLVVACFGFGETPFTSRSHADAEQLATYEAARGRRSIER
jgi:hypothetical protein